MRIENTGKGRADGGGSGGARPGAGRPSIATRSTNNPIQSQIRTPAGCSVEITRLTPQDPQKPDISWFTSETNVDRLHEMKRAITMDMYGCFRDPGRKMILQIKARALTEYLQWTGSE